MFWFILERTFWDAILWLLGCSISKCENKAYCVFGKYDVESNIDMDDCTATEKMWVSYEAYQNRISKKVSRWQSLLNKVFKFTLKKGF